MQLRTLAQMRSKVVFEADLPPPTATSVPALADLNARINEGITELHRLLVGAAAEKAYEKTFAFTTQVGNAGTPGQTDYPLPNDFYELKWVRTQINGQDWRNLDVYTLVEESYLMSASPGFSGEPFKYRLVGKKSYDGSDTGTLRLLPPPSVNINVQVGYIFGPPVLINDTDQIDGFAGYEDYAIQYAIKSCTTKIEEFDKSGLALQEMGRLKADLLGTMRSRDADRPPRVQMTRDAWFGRSRRRGGYVGS
jgi:hypothetical protein